jgi:hypothetical protein
MMLATSTKPRIEGERPETQEERATKEEKKK